MPPALRLIIPLHPNTPDLRRRIAAATDLDQFAIDRLDLAPTGLAMACSGASACLIIDRCGAEHVNSLRKAGVAFVAITAPTADAPGLYCVQRVLGDTRQIAADHSGHPVVRIGNEFDRAALVGVLRAQAEVFGGPRRRHHHHIHR